MHGVFSTALKFLSGHFASLSRENSKTGFMYLIAGISYGWSFVVSGGGYTPAVRAIVLIRFGEAGGVVGPQIPFHKCTEDELSSLRRQIFSEGGVLHTLSDAMREPGPLQGFPSMLREREGLHTHTHTHCRTWRESGPQQDVPSCVSKFRRKF